MSTSYTVEVYKADRRSKSGQRLINKFQHTADHKNLAAELKHLYETSYFARDGYSFKIYETYVTRKNLITGKEYQERYDTPRCCSPSTESFWSM